MKKTAIALTLGLLIGSAGTAMAATSDTVQAVFAKFNFMVNGAEKKLAVDPLVVDGTSYLPVREVAGLLGYQLDYDPESRTIKLDNTTKGVDKVTMITDEWVSLRDLAEKEGLKISTNSKSLSLEKNGTLLTIEYIFSDGQIVGGKTPLREFGLKIENSVTLLNTQDLRSAGLVD